MPRQLIDLRFTITPLLAPLRHYFLRCRQRSVVTGYNNNASVYVALRCSLMPFRSLRPPDYRVAAVFDCRHIICRGDSYAITLLFFYAIYFAALDTPHAARCLPCADDTLLPLLMPRFTDVILIFYFMIALRSARARAERAACAAR